MGKLKDILKKGMGDYRTCEIVDCNKCANRKECRILKNEKEIREALPKKKKKVILSPGAVGNGAYYRKENVDGYNKAIDEVNKILFG